MSNSLVARESCTDYIRSTSKQNKCMSLKSICFHAFSTSFLFVFPFVSHFVKHLFSILFPVLLVTANYNLCTHFGNSYWHEFGVTLCNKRHGQRVSGSVWTPMLRPTGTGGGCCVGGSGAGCCSASGCAIGDSCSVGGCGAGGCSVGGCSVGVDDRCSVRGSVGSLNGGGNGRGDGTNITGYELELETPPLEPGEPETYQYQC